MCAGIDRRCRIRYDASVTDDEDGGAAARSRRPRARALVAGVFAAVGIALLVVGCLLPHLVIYLCGLIVVAVAFAVLIAQKMGRRLLAAGPGIRMSMRWGLSTSGFVVMMVIGLVIPIVCASVITNSDIAWTFEEDLRSRTPVTVEGQTYLSGRDGRITVLDASTGSERWAVEGTDFVVGVDGSLYIQNERRGEPVRAAFDRDGTQMWGADAVAEFDHPLVMAKTAETTVVRACGNVAAYDITECQFVGVDSTGGVRWETTIANPQASYLQQFQHLEALFGTQARVLPTSLAVLQGEGTDSSGTLLKIINPDTGDVLRTVEEGKASNDSGLYLDGDRMVLAEPATTGCRYSAYRGTKRLWTQESTSLCYDRFTDDQPTKAGEITRIVGDRAYIRVNGADASTTRLVTVDLNSGAYRTLRPAETAVEGAHSSTASTPMDRVGEQVVVSLRSDTMVGTDPASGRVRWRRPIPDEEAFRVDLGAGLLLSQPSDSHNPMLGRIPRLDSGGELEWVQQHRLTLLDTASGRAIASIIGYDGGYWPSYLTHEIRPDTAVITPSDDAPYRIGTS